MFQADGEGEELHQCQGQSPRINPCHVKQAFCSLHLNLWDTGLLPGGKRLPSHCPNLFALKLERGI